MEEGLGFRFYARLAGIAIAVAIPGLILMLTLVSRALYAWGFLGMFLLIAVVLLVIGKSSSAGRRGDSNRRRRAEADARTAAVRARIGPKASTNSRRRCQGANESPA